MTNRNSLILLMLSTSLLFGCSTTSSKNEEAGEGVSLEQRVNERWDALASKNFRIAYRYLSPGFRGVIDDVTYERRMYQKTVNWLAGKHTGQECESETLCKADVFLDFEVNTHMPGVGKQTAFQLLTENWIQSDGIWYFVPKS